MVPAGLQKNGEKERKEGKEMKLSRLIICGCLLLGGCASVSPAGYSISEQEADMVSETAVEPCSLKYGERLVTIKAPETSEPVTAVDFTCYFSRLTLIEKGILTRDTPQEEYLDLLIQADDLGDIKDSSVMDCYGDTIRLTRTLTEEEMNDYVSKIYESTHASSDCSLEEFWQFENMKEAVQKLHYTTFCEG